MPKAGIPAASRSAIGLEQAADDSSSIDIVVDSPPGRTSASTSSRSAGVRTSTGVRAERQRARAACARDRALQREDADLHRHLGAPATGLPAPLGELGLEPVDLEAGHGLAEARG